MELLQATPDLLDPLAEMNIQLRADENMDNVMTPDEVRSRMLSFLQSNEYSVFVLNQNSEIKGYAVIKTGSKPMFLRQIFVKREFRKQGLGAYIINELLKKLNINEMDLEVMAWNQAAIEFYEKFGFKRRYIGMRFKTFRSRHDCDGSLRR
jgi:ribosomal protein S18 acetylase RimI-like enzyme